MTELVFAGDIIDIKVMVRNSGQVSATMITVRCLADDQTISTGTIPVLMPGELGSVICDWQAPVDDSSVLLEAIVDRGTQIDESNEDNNQDSIVIAIGEAVQEPVISDGTSSFQVSQTTLLLGAGAVLLLILTIFGLFAPAKIKKIE
jgi:subtilase family serine protease